MLIQVMAGSRRAIRMPRLQPAVFTNSRTPVAAQFLELSRQFHPNAKRSGASAESLGDEKTGHILAKSNEGILFFDNIFPLRLRWLLPLTFHSESTLERLKHPRAAAFDPVDLLSKALPKGLPVEITGVTPRLKEGGAFVKFSHDNSISAEEIETVVRKSLRESSMVRPWFNPFERVHARLVQGRPWVEDLYRPPTAQLKVEFVPPEPGQEAAELSQEQLFSIFRPYGKLREITSQPPDSKVMPKYALIDFASTRRGILAKNCLHGIDVASETDPKALVTKLKIGYERKSKTSWFRELSNHPRIVIPILAVLLTSFTVAVFDPIRTFNIKLHIKQTLHLTNNSLYKWFATRATSWFNAFTNKEQSPGMSAIWQDRKDNIDQIERWLMESADTFIVVQGPRGSGKRELVVDAALKHRKNKLVIDCKRIQEARGDAATICAMAEQVGYRPVFSWLNSVSGMIDLAAQGATGMKTGFSETLDGQLNAILNNTAAALRQLGLEGRNKTDNDANVSDDVYLETHPEARPVVVIDNFLHKSQESNIIYDKLAEWAASSTTANVAHVIFLTTDVSFSKSLSKALPDRVFRQLSLGDCSLELAHRFVLSHLETDNDKTVASPTHFLTNSINTTSSGTEQEQKRPAQFSLDDLDKSLEALGGRLTDLEFLARRIKAGETPAKAVREIIDQSASEILKMYILTSEHAAGEKKWTSEQAWTLIKSIATSEDGTLRYNEILIDDSYKSAPGGPDGVLQALEQAELITISSANGRPNTIRPGKPVFLPAFKQIAGDRVLSARLDLGILGAAVKGEGETIAKCEEELKLLGKLPKQPPEVGGRVKYLLAKIQKSQVVIEKAEADVVRLKCILTTEY